MGCDIHLNLEYRGEAEGSNAEYEIVLTSDFHVGRAYGLFAALAGVRNFWETPVTYPPRGVPADVCAEIFERYFVEVVPDKVPDNFYALAKETMSVSQAAQYPELERRERWGRRFVAESDYHHASHLTLAEAERALAAAEYAIEEGPVEFRMVMGFMRVIDGEFGAGASRVVFWFDN